MSSTTVSMNGGYVFFASLFLFMAFLGGAIAIHAWNCQRFGNKPTNATGAWAYFSRRLYQASLWVGLGVAVVLVCQLLGYWVVRLDNISDTRDFSAMKARHVDNLQFVALMTKVAVSAQVVTIIIGAFTALRASNIILPQLELGDAITAEDEVARTDEP